MAEHIFYKGIRRTLAATGLTIATVVLGIEGSAGDATPQKPPTAAPIAPNSEVMAEAPTDQPLIPSGLLFLGALSVEGCVILEYTKARARKREWQQMGIDGRHDELSYFDEGTAQAFNDIALHWDDK